MSICERFKDLILTDYIDHQSNSQIKKQIDDHLAACSACRVFEQEIKETLVNPFKTEPAAVPERVWLSIKESIEEEHLSRVEKVNWAQRLKEWFAFPRLVPVIMSLVLVLWAGTLVFQNQQIRQAKDQEQGEYLVYLLAATDASSGQESNASQSPIEQYFL